MDEALALLQHVKWDKERLLESYFNDADKMRKEVGLAALDAKPCKQGDVTCRICYDDKCAAISSLACGHAFCSDCYGQYLHIAVGEGPTSIMTRCPQHKCGLLVPRGLFVQLVCAEDLAVYDEYLLRNYISTCKAMRHCPAPRCDKVSIGAGISSILCSCGTAYCFRCGEDAHEPSSCKQLAEWSIKCQNDSETANWILANTKRCPKCQTRIEKNQGCNRMTCRQCTYQFCWSCMEDWKVHGYEAACNRYTVEQVNSGAEQTEAARAKMELDRYLHYYKRYHGHDQGMAFAVKQMALVAKRIAAAAAAHDNTDLTYVREAAEQVLHCRRVLKYTYVLGYYLKDAGQVKLFEHHQEMLEMNTEKLQEYSESKALESMDRGAVINLTRVTERFMSSLLANMAGGIVRADDAIVMVPSTPSPAK